MLHFGITEKACSRTMEGRPGLARIPIGFGTAWVLMFVWPVVPEGFFVCEVLFGASLVSRTSTSGRVVFVCWSSTPQHGFGFLLVSL